VVKSLVFCCFQGSIVPSPVLGFLHIPGFFRSAPAFFCPKERPHRQVKSFKGERFSIVFFTVGCHAKAESKVKAELTDLGRPG
jgi:hypothetical protein